ncbi:tubulin glycylase 3B-like [Topomyia yanbarensis]|uniref:tubulin glycylase 3B-like n=1 Tax=Topomyia yanbarensis TaxID=2498891 RepID=UPI00273BF121|nr:tubulin glycylase 3B-like [Topomyia yanbarensis]XP_058819907.1 tubulin glycylase 3B-like [Topomyia yanbarensis]XP_058819908.1 tubulin glycylase 3B-like [Topomyia yanbarensis]XP_058819909.1 tubulin glycylase 3B-like [Topomyia yanbarensis]XP_058819910.1 tubulin glycylase 3B-like [Topomyia yanbarensis]XP_058819911.1 tubulin glycylase 3B-like [Topomyia yanbarensis]
MHLKVKHVDDIWDQDPGVDLSDVTLQLGKLDVHKRENTEVDRNELLKRIVLNEKTVNSKHSAPTESVVRKNIPKTFPRTKQQLKDRDCALNQRKRRFCHNYSFNFQKHKQLKVKIAAAVEKKNIFSIVGPYPALRKALKKRNWLEKQTSSSSLVQNLSVHSLLHKAQEGNEYEEALISKILKLHNADFIWQNRRTKESKKDRFYTPYRSRICYDRNFDFTMKEGLVNVTESIQWFQEIGIAELDCPRTYILNSEDDITKFLEDFQLTACTAFLYYLSKFLDSLFDEDGTKSVDIIHTAMKYCKYHLACCRHEDIDYHEYCEPLLTAEDRSTISEILTNGARFKLLPGNEVLSLVAQVKKLVLEAATQFPDMKIDGVRNMWILKPGNRCRGIGIMIFRDDRKLLDYVDRNSELKYVAQKYIEKPLLIHNTKFDIRQYFLITFTGNQLKVWMYRNSYLRFSSLEFNLDDFNEAIHLTNYSIQKYYAGTPRKPGCPLPACNMWSSKQFQQHLQSLDKGYYWERKIYPDMKRNILSVVTASMDGMRIERNMFELYGADFMVTENFRTMLIEINSSPDLSSSTEVTEVICPAVLEDLVKVVIDNTNDKRADTGDFECIQAVEIPRVAPYGYGLTVEGKPLGSKSRCKSPLAPLGPPMCSLNRSRTARSMGSSCSTPTSSKRSSASSSVERPR